MSIATRSLRLACDLGSPDAALDPRTNLAPVALRRADLTLELAAFRDGAIVDDVGNYATLTAIIRPVDAQGVLGDIAAEIEFDGGDLTACTLDAWRAVTGQHAQIIFPRADLDLADGRYRLTIYGVTSAGLVIPWAHCPFTILDVGLPVVAPPVPGEGMQTIGGDPLQTIGGETIAPIT